jgi:uncharacterized membrane protein
MRLRSTDLFSILVVLVTTAAATAITVSQIQRHRAERAAAPAPAAVFKMTASGLPDMPPSPWTATPRTRPPMSGPAKGSAAPAAVQNPFLGAFKLRPASVLHAVR